MQRRRVTGGLLYYLGVIQYGTFLSVGGALWFIIAQSTGFFWSDPVAQVVACLLLLVLIVAEAWWIYVPGSRNELADFTVDLLTSAAIAGFGMGVVLLILAWLPK